eukprot:TRINITY_DN29808_c0_g1_i2.p1 TRINITY_DN29808_c0_g1~~TRINITY_DN29808_c0_g1_i2.p1  ORF type:complete len:183 (+),score=31.93 TRINITY_DN29808_c0_g1_i2:67-549(+)
MAHVPPRGFAGSRVPASFYAGLASVASPEDSEPTVFRRPSAVYAEAEMIAQGAVEGRQRSAAEAQAVSELLAGGDSALAALDRELAGHRQRFTKQFAELQGQFQQTHVSIKEKQTEARQREERIRAFRVRLENAVHSAGGDLGIPIEELFPSVALKRRAA